MHYKVTDTDTAAAVGSGDVPVLATPRLIAWMEAATVQAAAQFIEPGQTTVGTGVCIEHRRASGTGGTVEVTAEPPAAPDGKRISFQVRATDQSGEVVAEGRIDRAIVDRERFLAALPNA
jgi:predicted thioesterase